MEISVIVLILLMAVGPAIGMWTASKQKNSGGSAPDKMAFGANTVAISSVAAANSGFIMIAAVGYGYVTGISALWMPIAYFLGDCIYWFIFAPKLIARMQEENKETISELFASVAKGWAGAPLRIAAIIIFLFVGLNCASQFMAAGKAASVFFDSEQSITMLIVICISLAAVMFGGVSSSIQVNVYQGSLMLLVAFMSLVALGIEILPMGSDLFTQTSVPAGFWDPFGQFQNHSFYLFFIAYLFLGMTFAMTQPHILARLASGQSGLKISSIRWRYLTLLQAMWISMTLFGIFLYVLEPGLSDPENGILIFGEKYLPGFVVGVILAGIVAGALSTAEAQLLVISNAIGLDVFPKVAKKLRAKNRRLYDALFLVLCAGLLLVFTLQSESSVLQLIIVAASSISAAFVGPILCVIFKVQVEGRLMAFAMALGGGTSAYVGLNGLAPGGFELLYGTMASCGVLVLGIVGHRLRSRG